MYDCGVPPTSQKHSRRDLFSSLRNNVHTFDSGLPFPVYLCSCPFTLTNAPLLTLRDWATKCLSTTGTALRGDSDECTFSSLHDVSLANADERYFIHYATHPRQGNQPVSESPRTNRVFVMLVQAHYCRTIRNFPPTTIQPKLVVVLDEIEVRERQGEQMKRHPLDKNRTHRRRNSRSCRVRARICYRRVSRQSLALSGTLLTIVARRVYSHFPWLE